MPSADSDAPLFLVGSMGAGKSSVGERLAALLARRFVDLDRLIEEWASEPIAQLFEAGRENDFRDLERGALRGCDAKQTGVATGGGTVTHSSNLEHMLARGTVVYLRADPATLATRLAGAERPLLVGHQDNHEARRARLAQLLDERRASYERAHHVLDTDALTLDEVAQQITRMLGVAHG